MKTVYHLSRVPALWVAALLLTAGLISNLVNGQSQELESSSSQRLRREGTKIEQQTVSCRSNGERLVVELRSEKQQVLALENLMAQRILESVTDDPNDRYWSVNGTLTEFQGKNFILLERVNRAKTH